MKVLLTSLVLVMSFSSFSEGETSKSVDRFDLVDENSDGKISMKEWLAKQTKRFKRIDKNNDGFITKNERDQFKDELIIIRHDEDKNN
ncbi:MAG: hypothetical protein CME70_24205 [Halobacteriovorax sp.]|nr:hypothetical protein [Halobacteriovorax sp.]|tara:strand:- start:21689 stop:21952 length:264 start_codon:yes stop_codon:yes gene_type:complete